MGVKFSTLSVVTLLYTYDTHPLNLFLWSKVCFFFLSIFRIPPEPLLKSFLCPVQLSLCRSAWNKSRHGERIVMNSENFKKKCLAIVIFV